MRFIFELSKEHKTLPTAEILACLNAEKIQFNIIESNEDVFVIESNADPKKIKILGSRLSLTFIINEFLFSCPTDQEEIKKQALNNCINEKGSIAIRYRNRSDTINSQSILRTLAGIYSKNRKVTLSEPDIEIRACITDTKVYVGLKTFEVDRKQLENRKVQHRPFFSPISLHPKLARSLINLSLIAKNGTFLDPFCGTGGLLIEAGLIGAKVVGSDIDDKMVEGCKRTLDFYQIKGYDLFCFDIGDINSYVSEVDAVATDLPYGKATTTKGENICQLYERAFMNIFKVLKKDGRAVIGLSNKDMLSVGEQFFSLTEIHEVRAHRSLTRYFVVYEK